MISAITISAALAVTGAAETAIPSMPIRLQWVKAAKALLSSLQAADRPAAYRNYADMLVDIGECDAAVSALKGDASFDAELIVSAMAHASSLGERRCAAQFGELAGTRIALSTSPRRRAVLLMQAGAAVRVGGDDEQGAAIIAAAEKTLEAGPSEPSSGPASESAKALWDGRRHVLGTYAGTALFAPTMTRYGQELAAKLSLSRSYLPVPDLSGFVLRFAASGRTDLVDLIASKLWPADRREVISAARTARDPEFADAYGDNAAPHCVKPAGATGLKSMMPERKEPFQAIVELSIKSARAAMDARCAVFRK